MADDATAPPCLREKLDLFEGVGGATISLQNASQRSSGSSIVPRGYCFECPIPWHPHLPGPSSPGGGLPLTSPASLPNLPTTTQPGGTFIAPGNLTSTQLTSVFPGSSLPNLPAARQVGGTFSIPSSQGGMPSWHIGSSELPSTQHLSQLPSVFGSPTRPTAGQGRGTFSIPCNEGMPSWHIGSSELPSTQHLSQLPSVFGSPTRPTAGQGRGTFSIPGDEGMPNWIVNTAELPSTQYLSQLTSVFGSPIRPTAGQGGLTFSIPSAQGTPEPPSTQNLSQLTSVFGSSLPSTQLISQLPSAFLSPATAGQGGGTFSIPCAPGSPEAASTQSLSPLPSIYMKPTARPRTRIFTFPSVPGSTELPSTQQPSQLPSIYMKPTSGQGGGTFFPSAQGTPEPPSTQNLSHLTSVFGSSLPTTQLISQLSSPFGSRDIPSMTLPTEQHPFQPIETSSPIQPAQEGGTFSIPCAPGSLEASSTQSLSPLPSVYMKPTARPRTRIFTFPSVPGSPELPSMQSFSPLPSIYMKPTARPRTRIFTFPSVPGSPELPSTQQPSQLPSIYMKPTSGQGGGTFFPSAQGTPEPPSTQNLSHLTSVFGSSLPTTQLISQLSSPFGSRDIPSMTLPTEQHPFQPVETSSPIQPAQGANYLTTSISPPSGPCPPSDMVPSWDSYGGLQLPPPISDPFSQFSSDLFPSGPGMGAEIGKPPLPRPSGLPLPAMPSTTPLNLSQYLHFPGDIYNLGGDPNQAPYSPGQFSPYSPSGIFSQPDACSPFSPGSSIGTVGTPSGSPFFPLVPGSPDMSSLYGPMAPGSLRSISGGLMTPSDTSASSGTSVFSSLSPDASIGTIPSPYSSLGATSPFLPVPPASSPDASSLYGPMFPASYTGTSSLFGPMVPASSGMGSPMISCVDVSSLMSPLGPASSLGTVPSPYSSLGATSPFLPVPPASSPDASSLYGPMFPASYVSSFYGSMVPASTTGSSSPLFSSPPSSLLSPLVPMSSPGTICVPSPIQFSPLASSPIPMMNPRPVTPPIPPSPISQPVSPEPAEKSDRRTQAAAVSKDSKAATFERIVGEVAFQLDRRILSSIFPDRVRLYGFTVGNIPEKIMQAENDTVNPLTPEQRTAMMDRYNEIMNRLKPQNYNPTFHPQFTEHIVNTYGILRERPDASGSEAQLYNDPSYLHEVIVSVVPQDKVADCLILLNCLRLLSQADGKPLFIW